MSGSWWAVRRCRLLLDLGGLDDRRERLLVALLPVGVVIDSGVVTVALVPSHEATGIVVVRHVAADPEVQAPGGVLVGVGLDLILTVRTVGTLPDGEQVARVPDGVPDALAHEHDAHVGLLLIEHARAVVALPEEEATLAGRVERHDGLLDGRVVHDGVRAVHGLVDGGFGLLHDRPVLLQERLLGVGVRRRDLDGRRGDDLGGLGVRMVEGHRHGRIRATGSGDDEEGKELTSHGWPPGSGEIRH